MKILIAPDKFKGSLSAPEVCQILRESLEVQFPGAEIFMQPMADGGDGSLDLLQEIWEMEKRVLSVPDALGRPVEGTYFTSQDTAWIELAQASGIARLGPEERNAMRASTRGTGELIRDAVSRGYSKIRLFIGGSASNEAGLGIASALGYTFYHAAGHALFPVGENLSQISHFTCDPFAESLREIDWEIVCDVRNPFFGPEGAAYVYGPQKGANREELALLDQGLQHLHRLFLEHKLIDVQALPGAGAAGGVGGGLAALFGAKLLPGIQMFIDTFQIQPQVAEVDWVITGEGRLDEQSLQGKVVGGLLELCQASEKPLLVVCGQNSLDSLYYQGTLLQKVWSLLDFAPSPEEAMAHPRPYLLQLSQALGAYLAKFE